MSDDIVGGAAAEDRAAKGGDVGESTQPGARVPEGVSLVTDKPDPMRGLEGHTESITVIGAGGLPEGTLHYTPEDDVAAAPLDARESLGAESGQASEAPLVTTSAESTVGGVEASEFQGAAGAGGPQGEPKAGSELAGEGGAAPVVASPDAAPAVPNSPERESDQAPASSPPDVAAAPSQPDTTDSPPAGDVPEFLKKSNTGTPVPVDVVRTGFSQLAPPEDTELVKVWRVSDPTRWFWARQVDTFLAATLVWQRNAYMLSQYPGATVLTGDELRELA